jgi:glyoxylase-like metal-dependent hydrolase (beta-lactamase superfamily II)
MTLTRRDFLGKTLLVAGVAALASTGETAAEAKLFWKHFPAGENGLFRAPVQLSGAQHAILIDGGFTLSDGKAIAEAIKASGKTLTMVYVSQSDPDYYFGLGPIRSAIPSAKIIAAPETVEAIKSSAQKKLDVWSPQLRDNGPKTLAEIVIPKPSPAKTLSLDGAKIEIVDAQGLANRRYLWVPSLEAVFGGVLVFSGLHVWTADTPTSDQRAAWVKTLESIVARNPRVVVPGHLAPGGATDVSAVLYTRDYLLTFEQELAKAPDSAALIEAMKRRYPDAGMAVALDIGAKVAKGERASATLVK